MKTRGAAIPTRACVATLAWVLSTATVYSALAADPAQERTQLALLVRQLDALERTAQQSEQHVIDGTERYHFDYARFYADLARIRSGIQNYLAPRRAQPRDPNALSGEYALEHASP